jgi:hypothetical protein
MKLPTIRGVIDRRILVNFRIEPGILGALLPAPFRPKLIRGVGLVGVCLIRLKHVRPGFLPSWLGVSSENAAHRAAVEWDDGGVAREGVYIWRRDTNSRLNALAGGRLFPGFHHHARFRVEESSDRYAVSLHSDDGVAGIAVRARRADRLPASSVFRSLGEASEFFRAGCVGYSGTPDSARFQGLELCCRDWDVEPLAAEEVRSSFFGDGSLFPEGAVEFDSALLMRGIWHEWHGRPDLRAAAALPSVVPQQAGARTRSAGAHPAARGRWAASWPV